MQVFNQFSYPIVALVLGVILLAGMIRIPQLSPVMVVVGMVVYVVLAFVVGSQFQYPDSPVEVETVDDVEAILINEQPSFVMLYSNY